MLKLNDKKAEAIGVAISEMFKLHKNVDDRFDTTWGDKTVEDLGRSILRIVAENTLARVTYKGDRASKQDYDNFTYDKCYLALIPDNLEDSGFIVLNNDKGETVLQPSIDFDYI
jgi:hypothetical protein